MTQKKGKAMVRSWGAMEDQIVLLYATGHFTHKDLGNRFEIASDQVKRILGDPRAEEIRALAREKIREGLVRGVEDELPQLASYAVQCIKRTLMAEISPTHVAKANQDRVALKVLTGIGYLREDGTTPEGGITLSPEQHKSLIDAIDRSNRVKQADGVEEMPAEVVEE